MLPTICRCCGLRIAEPCPENPNVCGTCAAAHWDVEGAEDALASGLEGLLEADGPSVLECYNAAAEAEQAIKETSQRGQIPAGCDEVCDDL